MNQALTMSRRKSVDHFQCAINRDLDIHWAFFFDFVRQRFARHQFHGDIRLAVVGTRVVNKRHARVGNFRCQLGFSDKSL